VERAEHIAEWIRLTEEKDKPAQVGQVFPKGGRGHKGGINAAARKLGIERKEVQRAVAIDKLSAEAKAAAVATGLTVTRSAPAPLGRGFHPSQKRTRRDISRRDISRRDIPGGILNWLKLSQFTIRD
jgi:hypothetical protein